jgi:hypothetical protein
MDVNLAFWLVVGVGSGNLAAEAELSAEIHTQELRAHVYRLSSPSFLGRRGPGAARTAAHLAEALKKLRLRPAFGDSYFQPFPEAEGRPEGEFSGRNVVAILPGSDRLLKDEWIVLSAHFDHLGVKDEVLYPGADDNATGVAMLLEVAEYFALCGHRPRRTLVFAFFDQEEAGLLGSRYFAAHPPLPLTDLKAFLTADMLGRSMGGVMNEYVFVLGSENSPRLRKLVTEVKPEKELTVARIGVDIIGTRSDYGPFRDKKVPFLFFSTGEHRDYHQPSDTPEKVDYTRLRRIACWIRDLTARLADDDEVPAWDPKALGPDFNEAVTFHILLKRVLEHVEVYPLTKGQRELVEGLETKVGAIVDRKSITPEERAWLAQTARLLMTQLK